VINIFDDIPARAADEIFTEVLVREHVRIEPTVSTGQFTPEADLTPLFCASYGTCYGFESAYIQAGGETAMANFIMRDMRTISRWFYCIIFFFLAAPSVLMPQ